MGRKSIADIRKEEIIDAFFKVVAEKGLANATIREIAEAAGCSQGMLHHYFENKEAMVLGVVENVIASYTPEFEREISKYHSPTERMQFLFSWFLDTERFDLQFCRAWMEIWILAKTHPAISTALRSCYRVIRDVVAEIIRDGIRLGEFGKVDADIMANLILGSIEGGTLLWVVDAEATPVSAVGEQRAKLFLHYLTGEV
ncbi:MAG: TetR family transcriptional regulator [Candidatus Abyssobacteria bacterium SURF_17]|jgi:AcrR family transcriptional regulator|uniref:TetR family transcriptional regulator n=1 Tax=Candidatus Abyssobacteria bacterium SURF_17 TaxID=2093361 RepID=A0A419EW54_9BACT|nr:MAG: TetR family transcriptional regulator [Candidatus Abyssubacteria bacterium SURF_17]